MLDGNGEWEFRLLGPVEAYRDGIQLPLNGKQRSLLTVLLLNANRVVATSQLAEAVWGQHLPASPEARVRLLISELRRAFGSDGKRLILTRQPGYLLRVGPDQIDVDAFRRTVAQAQDAAAHGRPEVALERYDTALAVWRGAALGGVRGAFADAEVSRLTELRERVAEDRAEVMMTLGRHAELVPELRRLVVEHPLRERPHAQLMMALYRSGRCGEALELYAQLRKRLVEELGLEPTPQLQRLQQQILAGDPALHPPVAAVRSPASSARPSSPAPRLPARQLPPAPGRIVGRVSELAQLDALAARCDGPLLVVGAAGAGKTTLAVHWAHRVMDRFPDGQLFLDMHGFDPGARLSPADALPQLLQALGVTAEEIPVGVDALTALYRSALAGRRLLIILDNVAEPDQVRPLLPGGPDCLVLVTSRDRLGGLVALNGAGRMTIDVLPPLDAIEVLAHTAGAELIDADPDAAAALARLCGHLPLALRIAAGRLVDQPYHSLRGQVDELTRRGRMAGLRISGDGRASVRGAFDLSYRALPRAAQRLFRLLGLVPAPAGWSAEAGAALAGLAVDDAGQLFDTLARLHLITASAAGRYGCHDLLLEYAAELAAGDPPAQRDAAVGRLLAFYLHTTDQAAAAIVPAVSRLPRPPLPAGVVPVVFPDVADARRWMIAEWENVVGGLRHAAVRGLHRLAWQLADALRSHLYLTASRPQWLAIAETGLAAATAEGDAVGEAAMRFCLGFLRYQLAEFAESIREYERAVELYRQAGWKPGESTTLRSMGVSLANLGQLRPALGRFTQALALDREIGNEPGEAAGLQNIAGTYKDLGDLERAARYLSVAIPLLRRVGRRPGEAIALINLGELRREQGRLDEALAAVHGSLAICREIGLRQEEAEALITAAEVHRDAGRRREAHRTLEQALDIAQLTGNPRLQMRALNGLASVEIRDGRASNAVARLDAALEVAARSGCSGGHVKVLLTLSEAYCALADYQSARHYASWALSLARESGAMIEIATAHDALAVVYLGLGNPDQGIIHCQQALQAQRRSGQRRAKPRTLMMFRRARRLRRAANSSSGAPVANE
ncbi:BTAD domain-containing putative transcriptional regulator [Micromonospora sp. NPDC006766]|uniref:AfsR/SARP family transcriptional regulator n=1 Tax=Micromonospora sp. NPDC006766 TaxID=3154778 RepID=UPI0033FBC90A